MSSLEDRWHWKIENTLKTTQNYPMNLKPCLRLCLTRSTSSGASKFSHTICSSIVFASLKPSKVMKKWLICIARVQDRPASSAQVPVTPLSRLVMTARRSDFGVATAKRMGGWQKPSVAASWHHGTKMT